MMADESFAIEAEAVCVVTAADSSTLWLSIIINSKSGSLSENAAPTALGRERQQTRTTHDRLSLEILA